MNSIDQVRQAVVEAFTFLVEEQGMCGPAFEPSGRTTYLSLLYIGADIGVKIGIDLAPLNISVYVSKLEEGRIPPMGYLNIKGQPRKTRLLEEALRILGKYDRQHTEMYRKLRGNWDKCRELAELEAGLLRQTWGCLLQNKDRLFEVNGNQQHG